MEKTTPSIPKRPNYRHFKSSRKKQAAPPTLKVVYITNPIRFETSAAEFRALVQELTGQGAAYPTEFEGFPASNGAGGGGGEAGAAKAATEENNPHAVDTKVWRPSEGETAGRGSDPLGIGSDTDDGFYAEILDSDMVRDVLKSGVL